MYKPKRSLLFLTTLSLMSLLGCNNPKEEVKETESSTSLENVVKTYLALGDSYTIGEAVEEQERWPVELVSRLNKKSINFAQPDIIAQTGWTTDELQEAIKEANLFETYDMVSLLIGVNNQYRGEAKGYDTATYRKEFRQLLNQAVAFADGKSANVFVVSIPDYGVTPFVDDADRLSIAQEIAVYNEINRQETEARNVPYFDITPVSKTALDDTTLVAEDKLHPSGKMYALWVDVIEPKISQKWKGE